MWGTAFRGRLLIHASAGIGSRREFSDQAEALADLLDSAAWTAFHDEFLARVNVRGERIYVPAPSLLLGGVVGIATLDHVIEPTGLGETDRDRWWHSPDQFGLVLREVRPVPFAPRKGALGLFDLAPPEGVDANGQARDRSEGSPQADPGAV